MSDPLHFLEDYLGHKITLEPNFRFRFVDSGDDESEGGWADSMAECRQMIEKRERAKRAQKKASADFALDMYGEEGEPVIIRGIHAALILLDTPATNSEPTPTPHLLSSSWLRL